MKKLFCILLSAALVLPVLSACGGETWDISKNRDGSLTAFVEEKNGKRTLVVEGEGEMRDFKEGTQPWYSQCGTIEAVEVGSKVTSIGYNAFRGIPVPYILLPESVALIGSGAAGMEVKLFAENAAATDLGAVDVYYYSETLPETADVYWQQDKSTGDVTDGLHSAERRYFRYDGTGTPVAWEFYKVLFIGNSFTYRNGYEDPGTGVPGIFDAILKDLGVACETYMITGPGWHLKDHANPQDACGKEVDLLLNAVHDFDYIVLQEHSTDSIDKFSDFESGVRAIQEKAAATQSRAEVVLYETWGSPTSAKARNTTVADMEAELKTVYERAADDCGIPLISYVGKAFTEIYGAHQSEKAYYLWDTDNRHQGYVGAYLSACVHAGTLFGLDVRECLYGGEENAPAPADSVLFDLREEAYSVVFG